MVLPRTIGILNGLSHTLEVYRKVLHVLDCISEGHERTWLYIRRPLVDACTLDITTTDLSSHVPCVYRETLLGFLYYLRKSLWSSCWSNTLITSLGKLLHTCHPGNWVFKWGTVDPPHHVLLLDPVVYHELNLIDNHSERLAILSLSYHLLLLANFSLNRCVCVCFSSFWPRVENLIRHPGWEIYKASFP